MGKNQNDIIAESLEVIKERIQGELNSLNIDYTGQLSQSLEVKNTAIGAVLMGDEYLPTSYDNVGRGPGRGPFINPDWVRSKGIVPRDLRGRFISFESFAILVSRKIAREGTDRHTGKRPGVDIETIIEEEKPEMLRRVSKSFVKRYAENIKKGTISTV